MVASQIRQFAPRLTRDGVEPRPQDDEKANYWRKRSKDDGEIESERPGKALRAEILYMPFRRDAAIRSLARFRGSELDFDAAERFALLRERRERL